MQRSKKRILIIDDDEQDLLATKELLEHEGYEAITHRYGFGAIEAIRSLHPDLVLLDINMPGLSGDNIASIISFMNEGIALIPIVFYSSIDEDSLRERVNILSEDTFAKAILMISGKKCPIISNVRCERATVGAPMITRA